MTRSVHLALPAVMAAAGLALGLLAAPAPSFAQMSQADMVVRLDQLEGDVRRLTGAVEELQYRNQQLEQALRQLQGGGAQGGVAPARPGPATAPAAPAAPAPVPNRRSDVFDPAQNPNAPGAPRVLGSPAAVAGGPISEPPAPIPPGPGGGDQVGAPLDLGNNPNGPSPQLATLPPSQSPRDEFDLAYGYVLRKDFSLAQQAFQEFLKKYPSDPMAAEAQFWLGESLFQGKNYQPAAEAFVTMTKKYPTSPKQPDSLLRLGQSLAALQQRDLACVTLAEVGKKFPRAAQSVKAAVEREMKRVHC
jgi:tol-pal system protein YbgF